MCPKANVAIKRFLYNTKVNKYGISYSSVKDCDREKIEPILEKFSSVFVKLFSEVQLGNQIFSERLSRIDALRLDDSDQNLMPLKIAYDDMKQHHGDLNGGLFLTCNDGVFLLDMDFIKLSKAEAMYTLIHELVHAMTLRLFKKNGKIRYQTGVNNGCSKVLKHLNEGITEYIAQIFWQKMYPRVTCPGIGRYKLQVEVAKMIIAQMPNQSNFIEDYIIDANQILEQMKNITDNNNQNLYDFIMSFENKDLADENVQLQFTNHINNFKNVLSTTMQLY